MARRGWLRASEPKRSKAARVYRLTPRGHEVLAQLRHALDELYGEVGAHEEKGRATRAVTPQSRNKRSNSSSRVRPD
jgi:DNA-binding PadR family transcriptional regulator